MKPPNATKMPLRQPNPPNETAGGPAEAADGNGGAAEGGSDAAQIAGEDTDTDSAGRPRRRLLAGRWAAAIVVVAAVPFVGSAAFAGAAVQPYLNDRATAATKMKVARTAANAITTLWTYTPENMDTLADRASAYLSGDFEAQYRKFVDTIVAPNKQAK